MSDIKQTKKEKQSFAVRFEITKRKVITSILAAFAAPFLILIYSSFTVYFSNAEELVFTFSDFAPMYIIGFFLLFILLFVSLILTRKRAHNILFAVFSAIAICGYVQTFFTTLTFKGLPGDGNKRASTLLMDIINAALWVLAIAAFIILCAFVKKSSLFKQITSLLLVLITVIQVFSLIPSSITYASNPSNRFENEKVYYLSTKNLLELSSKENIVVFVLDTFDRDYIVEYMESDPDALDGLDGFTYYDDNIAAYPRTFPGTTSILTGMTTDFSLTRDEYFSEAYKNSQLFKDLKSNDYKINLYMPNYYAYNNADVFLDVAENISLAEGYEITHPVKLGTSMFLLSSYFWLPDAAKSQTIAASSFHESGEYISDAPMYYIDKSCDPDFYSQLTSQGLSLTDDKNVFSFIQLRGCHPPYAMNENCEEVSSRDTSSVQQTEGVFKIIKEYIRQMKELGIYDDATIIITGDHAGDDGWENVESYDHAMNTALLVKEKGSRNTGVSTSNAPVSQENFLAEIVKSAGLETDYDYGLSYSEIGENEENVRTHYFLRYTVSQKQDEVITYEITGDGRNFENWKEVDRYDVGYIYE